MMIKMNGYHRSSLPKTSNQSAPEKTQKGGGSSRYVKESLPEIRTPVLVKENRHVGNKFGPCLKRLIVVLPCL